MFTGIFILFVCFFEFVVQYDVHPLGRIQRLSGEGYETGDGPEYRLCLQRVQGIGQAS